MGALRKRSVWMCGEIKRVRDREIERVSEWCRLLDYSLITIIISFYNKIFLFK